MEGDTKNLTPNRDYYIDPSETRESFKSPLILSGSDNYPKWYRAMVMGFTLKKKLGFADGEIAVPAKDHPMYGAWKQCNEVVLSWILKAVSPEIAESVREMGKAVDVWRNLKERFSPGDQFMISDILEEIYSLRQGERDVGSYFNEFGVLWNELELLRPLPVCTCVPTKCSCCAMQRVKEQIEQEKVGRFLKGLDDQRFVAIRSRIMREDPLPPIGEVYISVSQLEDTPSQDLKQPQSQPLSTAKQASSKAQPDKVTRIDKIQLDRSIHPCPLTLKPAGEPYICSGCKERGFGPSYRCESSECNDECGVYVLHEDCANAAVDNNSPVRHPFFHKSNFLFRTEPPGHIPRICDACRQDVKGFEYHSSDTDMDLHPCCLKLKDSISDREGNVTLKLSETNRTKCKICGEAGKNNDKGWSYASSNGKHCYHVSCTKEFINEKYEKGYFFKERPMVTYDNPQTQLEAPGNTEMVKVRGSSSGSGTIKTVSKISSVVFKLTFSVIFGDPVSLVGGLLEALDPAMGSRQSQPLFTSKQATSKTQPDKGEDSSSSPPSTSILPPRSCTYHVFLSFSKEDTRKGITGHLHAALERKGIKTFIDDKDLERGEVISSEFLKAIEESMFAITVFSPNYASSSWCLDELQHIVECRQKLGLSIVPVLYGVEPSDVRHQKGNFAEAFKKHEERFGENSEKIRRWRDALAGVASLSGFHFKDKHEATLVECIAEHIHKKLIPKMPSSTKNLVGIASRVEEVMRHIGIGLNDVRSIGIWGMGGLGKKTIARAVYEAIHGEFEVSCFLSNLREARERNRIADKQKELVAQANINTDTLNNEHDGQRIIQTSLCKKKVLLVLDDVSDEVELKNLAGEKNWFGQGSRIIITTRYVHLLEIYKVQGTYEVKAMDHDESFDLFCSKAFKQKIPTEEYLDLSKEVVEYSGGLPLVLEVLGSHLCGRSVDVWHDAIKKGKSTQPTKIHDTLKICYDNLDVMEKNIFLDIACFFEGEETNYVTKLLEICGYNARIGIDLLIDRSLIKKNEESNVFEMHDLLRDMGKTIVIQESPNNPGKRSRLWSKADIDLVLQNNKGTKAIQAIVLSSGYEAWWSPNAFSNISDLKLLIIQGVELPFSLSCLPTSLKVLHWWRYPLKTLPLAETQYEFVGIELQFSKIEELWHGKKFLGNLKYLDLSHSWYLKRTPDLSEVPVLETLVLEECSDLAEVHPSVVKHKNLVLLNLSKCIRLKTFPGKLHMCSLRELILKECWSLEHLPEFGKCMKQLSRLSLEGAAVRELPTGCSVEFPDLNLNYCKNIVCLPNTIHGLESSLKIPDASDCSNLFREEHCGIEFKLPESISRLSFLSSLDLSYCGLTEESFPHDFCRLSSLVNLNLDGNYFVSIPICIRELPKLRCLKLNSCKRLQFLPELPSSIRQLEACNCPSLSTSEFNPLSEACNIFASLSQDSAQVLQMLISGSKIPSWFVHKEDGNCVSAPVPQKWSLNELMGIVLCFKLHWNDSLVGQIALLDVSNGNTSITNIKISPQAQGYHLYILYLTNDGFSHEIHPDNHFELSIKDVPYDCFRILSSAASWVRIKDIEDLTKSETERPKIKLEDL